MPNLIHSVACKLAQLKRLPTSSTSTLGLVVLMGTVVFSAEVLSRSGYFWNKEFEKDHPAPIIRGGKQGGVAPNAATTGKFTALASSCVYPGFGVIPSGGARTGLFSCVFDWPIIGLHLSLLPDGRVLSYGTNTNGTQGAVVYDVWNPQAGSHTTLPNGSTTDVFCSTAALFGPGPNNTQTPLTGDVVTFGGDLTDPVTGQRNYGNSNLDLFTPANNSLSNFGTMKYPRWYPSSLPLPNGDRLILGGRQDQPNWLPGGARVPEIYSATNYSSNGGWRTMSEVSISDFGYGTEWWYPRATIGKDGAVYIFEHYLSGIYRLTIGDPATLTKTNVVLAQGDPHYPAVNMPVKPYLSPYKMLTIRSNKVAQVVDLSTTDASPPNNLPKVTTIAAPNFDRQWGDLTVLADGSILFSGGSGVENQLTNVAYQAEIYYPARNVWSLAATATQPRLYHSSTLLLPDATVLISGGGAPGPLNNLNSEIYYPPYLYNADGTVAKRPTIVSAPNSFKAGQIFQLTVNPGDQVAGINLVRLGSSTHSYDSDARFIYAYYIQNGTTVIGLTLKNPTIVLPGYYMMFVVDSQGHPSIAKIVAIPPSVQ